MSDVLKIKPAYIVTKVRYNCYSCDDTFTTRKLLTAHVSRHHWKIYSNPLNYLQCTICGKFFKYKSKLDKHVKTHMGKFLFLTCRICTSDFRDPISFKAHLEGVHQKYFEHNYKKYSMGVTDILQTWMNLYEDGSFSITTKLQSNH